MAFVSAYGIHHNYYKRYQISLSHKIPTKMNKIHRNVPPMQIQHTKFMYSPHSVAQIAYLPYRMPRSNNTRCRWATLALAHCSMQNINDI